MDVCIFDEDLRLTAIIDGYKSLIWAKRYNEVGDCELYVPATAENLGAIRIGCYIGRTDDDMICRVRKLEIDTDAENGNYIIATGHAAQEFLDQRIVWETMTCYSNAEVFARRMVDNALGAGAAPERQLLDSGGGLIFGIGASAGLTDRLSEQVSYKNVGEKIREYCLKFGWGYRVRPEAGILLFEVYKGADRRQTVIFSEDFENLSTTQYVEDGTKMGNVAVVLGEGQGADRMKTVSGGAEGAERHELYIDARDLSTTITYGELTAAYPGGTIAHPGGYTYRMASFDIQIFAAEQLARLEELYPDGELVTVDGVDYWRVADLDLADLPGAAPADTDSVTLREVLYTTYLYERGGETMSAYGFVTSFEGVIEPGTTFRYKIDYDLGDIVSVKNELGIGAAVRIWEIVEVFDDNGYHVEPKFENITEEG